MKEHCDEHSEHCVRLDHLESNISKLCRKVDRLIYLVIVTLISVITGFGSIYVSKLIG